MSTATAARRSRRIAIDIPLVVYGQIGSDTQFREETFSLSVSAHGVLLTLKNAVAIGQRILLMNRDNWDEREALVTFVGPNCAGLTEVGVQFTSPSPEFWSLNIPPPDWKKS